MKKTILFTLVFLGALQLKAQTETLIGTGAKVGGFGGPMLQFSSIGNDFALYTGGGGGAIFNGNIFIGGFGMGLSTDHIVAYNGASHYAELGFGGLWLGYIHKPSKLIHLNFSLPLGGGGLSFSPVNDNLNDPDFEDNFFVLNPSVGAELNVTSFMKVAVNGGYMIFQGVDNDWVSASKLNSPSMMLTLKFGYFAE